MGNQYLAHFQASRRERAVVLTWSLRDEAREVLVLSSTQGFAEQDISPTGDLRQQVIFQGRALHFRLIDASQADDVACCYAVFAKGDDGNWHLQLTETVEPTSESRWKRTNYDADSESLQRIAEMDVDAEVG